MSNSFEELFRRRNGRRFLLQSHSILKCHQLEDLSDPHSHVNPLPVLISSFKGGFQELSEAVRMLAFSVMSSSCRPCPLFKSPALDTFFFVMGITGSSVLILGYKNFAV